MAIKPSLQVAADACQCTAAREILYLKNLHIHSELVLYFIAEVLRVTYNFPA